MIWSSVVSGVVVGIGRAGSSGPVMRWAAAEAGIRDLPLTLLHVWDEPVELSLDLDPGSLPDVAGGVSSCAVPGPIAAALLSRHPDLLVLGGHVGSPHPSHLTLACLHQAQCPVVVVADSARPVTGRVVVGVCAARGSHTALRWAAEEARLRAAHLVVVYAWQLHPGSPREVLHPGKAVRFREAEEMERLEGWVHEAVGPVACELRATHGAPLDVLLDVAAGADLVVLGRGKHSGIGRLFHGAVGDDIGGLVPCPVAVIPEATRDLALL